MVFTVSLLARIGRDARTSIVLAALGTTACSAEGDDQVDQAGAAASEETPVEPVEARTSDIPTYNSQAKALSTDELCRVFSAGGVDIGEASVTCTEEGDGVVKLTASKGTLEASILANATDKFVLEYQGFDESHEYKNNRGQSLSVRFTFVTSGTHRTADGTQVDGSFRGDLLFANSEERFRFGYYFNQKL